MAGPQKPLWRTIFDAAERRVGPAAEALVRTATFADVVGAVSRVNHRNRLRTERVLRDSWHRLNLPAGSDVKRTLTKSLQDLLMLAGLTPIHGPGM